VIVIMPGYGYGTGYGYPPPPAYRRPMPPPAPVAPPPRWQSEWGFNLRVEGIPIGHTPNSPNGSAGLGGVGMSLRYRPVPAFAFDLGVDVLAGTDYNGFQRTEVPFSLNGILYLNPRSRVQVYLMGGGTISRAQVRSDFPAQQLQPVGDGGEYGATYTYAGGQGGGGFEFRLSRRVALDLDGLGFVRTRIGNIDQPEFIDHETGRTTNVSGGALIRGGLTFWW
jgi:opacity protein-like surface antigen